MNRSVKLGLFAVSALVACGFAACSGGQDGASTESSNGPGAASAVSGPSLGSLPSTLEDQARIVDTQHARIYSEEIGAEKALQWQAAAASHTQANVRPDLANPNFTISTGKPVVASVAIFGQSFFHESSADQMFFGVQAASASGVGITSLSTCTGTCQSNNFFALNNLHTTPTVQWSANVSGGLTASVALNGTGTEVFAMSDSGTLYCFLASSSGTPTTCTNWSNPTISITGKGITPWVDALANSVYVNDGNGNLYSFSYTTGAQQWKYAFAPSSPSRSWPVEANLVLYVGDGSGNMYRIVDNYPNAPDAGGPTTSSSVALSGVNSNCSGASSIDGSVSLDITASKVFLPWKGCIFSFPHYCTAANGCKVTSGTWGVTSSGWTGSTPGQTFQTWPTLDGTYAYWVIPATPSGATPVSSVWKAKYSLAYPIEGTPLVNSTTTDAGPPGATITSSPVVYSGNLYVGDRQGYVEEFGCASSKAASVSFLAYTNASGGSVNTPIVFDDSTGNIEYGFGNGATNGVAQFPLWESSPASNFNWNCPSGMVACDNQICGTGPTSTECVPTAECNTGAACQSVTTASATVQVGYTTAEGQNVAGTQGSDGGAVCPNGNVILGVLGASYGLPPATPDDPVSGNTFEFGSSCYATDSLSVTESDCPLNTSQTCSLDAYNGTFGDPCVTTGKHYYAWFACGAQIADAGADASNLPVFCSRQNVIPAADAGDPCQANPDGGNAFCQGSCFTGWGDCNSNLQYDGCETYVLGTDSSNCGTCGNVCPSTTNGAPACTAGVCSFTCNTGYTLCGGACENSSTAFQSDPNNCGSCGNKCTIAAPNCVSGTCTAPTTTGCSTLASVSGATVQVGAAASEGVAISGENSGNICPTGSVIVAVAGASFGTPPASPDDPSSPPVAITSNPTFEGNSVCHDSDSVSVTESQCATNSQTCSFTASNTTFVTDPCYGTGKHYYGWFICAPSGTTTSNFCSRENVVPYTGTDPCVVVDGGTNYCSGYCYSGFADCDSNMQSDGCETSIEGDVNNCGSCGYVCPLPTNASRTTCSSGTCGYVCNSGYVSCNGQCLTTADYQTDSNNCGGCGVVCPGGGTCTAGSCSAPTTACTKAPTGSSGGIYYAYAQENGTLAGYQSGGNICPSGKVIQAIVGADYGSPAPGGTSPAAGSPDGVNNGTTFQFSTTCHQDDSLEITEEECPLNSDQSCSFTVSNTTFVSDPCSGTTKRYYAWFVCAATQTGADAGSYPYYCSRQNVIPLTGSDPCGTTDGGTPLCAGTCMTGFGDCDNNLQSDGCEADYATDPNNCGHCGNVCTGSTPVCSGGSCVE